jgi:hypothetical protein
MESACVGSPCSRLTRVASVSTPLRAMRARRITCLRSFRVVDRFQFGIVHGRPQCYRSCTSPAMVRRGRACRAHGRSRTVRLLKWRRHAFCSDFGCFDPLLLSASMQYYFAARNQRGTRPVQVRPAKGPNAAKPMPGELLEKGRVLKVAEGKRARIDPA